MHDIDRVRLETHSESEMFASGPLEAEYFELGEAEVPWQGQRGGVFSETEQMELASGAVASVHVAAVPWAGSGFRMEIYGREGTLVTTGNVSSQRSEMLRLQGARGSHELRDLAIPERFVHVPSDFPRGDPLNVGQMYALFAEAIRTGQSHLPTFDTAVDLHHFVDTIKQASDTGRELPVA